MRETILQLLGPVLESEGVELVDLELRGNRGSRVLKIYIEAKGGVTLSKCESVSRRLSEELDIADVISGQYRLEVSSPGLGRPLRAYRDFQRNLNRDIKVHYYEDEKLVSLRGKLIEVTEEEIRLDNKKGEKTISLALIRHGKIQLPW